MKNTNLALGTDLEKNLSRNQNNRVTGNNSMNSSYQRQNLILPSEFERREMNALYNNLQSPSKDAEQKFDRHCGVGKQSAHNQLRGLDLSMGSVKSVDDNVKKQAAIDKKINEDEMVRRVGSSGHHSFRSCKDSDKSLDSTCQSGKFGVKNLHDLPVEGILMEPPFILKDDEFEMVQTAYYQMKKDGKYNLLSDKRVKYRFGQKDLVNLQMVLMSELLGLKAHFDHKEYEKNKALKNLQEVLTHKKHSKSKHHDSRKKDLKSTLTHSKGRPKSINSNVSKENKRTNSQDGSQKMTTLNVQKATNSNHSQQTNKNVREGQNSPSSMQQMVNLKKPGSPTTRKNLKRSSKGENEEQAIFELIGVDPQGLKELGEEFGSINNLSRLAIKTKQSTLAKKKSGTYQPVGLIQKKSKTITRRSGLARGPTVAAINSSAMNKVFDLDPLSPRDKNNYMNHPNCISVQNEINKWSDYQRDCASILQMYLKGMKNIQRTIDNRKQAQYVRDRNGDAKIHSFFGLIYHGPLNVKPQVNTNLFAQLKSGEQEVQPPKKNKTQRLSSKNLLGQNKSSTEIKNFQPVRPYRYIKNEGSAERKSSMNNFYSVRKSSNANSRSSLGQFSQTMPPQRSSQYSFNKHAQVPKIQKPDSYQMNIQETQELLDDQLQQDSEVNYNMNQYRNLISSMKVTKSSNLTQRPSINQIDAVNNQDIRVGSSFKGKFDNVTQSGEQHLPTENSTNNQITPRQMPQILLGSTTNHTNSFITSDKHTGRFTNRMEQQQEKADKNKLKIQLDDENRQQTHRESQGPFQETQQPGQTTERIIKSREGIIQGVGKQAQIKTGRNHKQQNTHQGLNTIVVPRIEATLGAPWPTTQQIKTLRKHQIEAQSMASTEIDLEEIRASTMQMNMYNTNNFQKQKNELYASLNIKQNRYTQKNASIFTNIQQNQWAATAEVNDGSASQCSLYRVGNNYMQQRKRDSKPIKYEGAQKISNLINTQQNMRPQTSKEKYGTAAKLKNNDRNVSTAQGNREGEKDVGLYSGSRQIAKSIFQSHKVFGPSKYGQSYDQISSNTQLRKNMLTSSQVFQSLNIDEKNILATSPDEHTFTGFKTNRIMQQNEAIWKQKDSDQKLNQKIGRQLSKIPKTHLASPLICEQSSFLETTQDADKNMMAMTGGSFSYYLKNQLVLNQQVQK